MAERRMFAKTIIDSDSFLDMGLTAQALYFHLAMRADDEGFINNPKKIARMIGAADDDLKVLAAKKFIIPFESGIVVIKHWKIHNYIRGDRIHDTHYSEERAMLDIKENGSYTLADSRQAVDRQLTDSCQTVDGQLTDSCHTEVRLGKSKDSKELGKVRVRVYYEDGPLNESFLAFIEMRKKIKAPMTDRAIELAQKNLEKLAVDPETKMFDEALAVEIVDQSTANCWKSFYPLHQEKKKAGKLDWIDNIDYGGNDGQLPFSDI